MTKEDFLRELRAELGFLPYDDINDAVIYYSEYFSDSQKSDEEVIRNLGTPKQVAQSYYNEYKRTGGGEDTAAPPVKNKFPWAAVIILLILSPVLIPVALTVIGILAAVFIVPVAIAFGMWFGGAGMIISAFASGMHFFDALFAAGIGCIMFAVGLVLSWFVILLIIKIGVWLVRKISDWGNRRLHGGIEK